MEGLSLGWTFDGSLPESRKVPSNVPVPNDQYLPLHFSWMDSPEPWIGISDGSVPRLILGAAEELRKVIGER